MRAEFLPLLALLIAPGAPAAASPCPKIPVVLAQVGAGGLGSGGPFEASLSFRLEAAGRVWAEASGLRGLAPEDRDSAPEVFLDDSYLGPLLADFGDVWRSPQALRLGPGEHQLLVRSAQEGEGPSLSWKTLRVLGDSPCLPEGPAPVPAPKFKRSLASPCGHLVHRVDWPARLGGRSLVLSAPGGRAIESGPLIRLRQGETWRALMKIPAGPDSQPLPLIVSFAAPAEGRVRFLVWVDHQAQGRVGALGYTPGVWESLVLSLCDGALTLRFAQEPPLGFACKGSSVEFGVAVRDMELLLAPVAAPDSLSRPSPRPAAAPDSPNHHS